MMITRGIAAAAMLAGLAAGTASTASAAPTMSGHYIVNETSPQGYSTTMDWHFTPCGDGCASVTIGGPAPGPMGQARLVTGNGHWIAHPVK